MTLSFQTGITSPPNWCYWNILRTFQSYLNTVPTFVECITAKHYGGHCICKDIFFLDLTLSSNFKSNNLDMIEVHNPDFLFACILILPSRNYNPFYTYMPFWRHVLELQQIRCLYRPQNSLCYRDQHLHHQYR